MTYAETAYGRDLELRPYGVTARPLRKRAWYSIGKVFVVLLIAFVLLVVLAAPLTFG